MDARPGRSVGNLVGALAIHVVLLPLLAYLCAAVAWGVAAGEDEQATVSDAVVYGGLAVGAGAWLALAGVVVRWWLKGREELWNVTLAWLTIGSLNVFVLPLLVWPRFRRWLGGSFRTPRPDRTPRDPYRPLL